MKKWILWLCLCVAVEGGPLQAQMSNWVRSFLRQTSTHTNSKTIASAALERAVLRAHTGSYLNPDLSKSIFRMRESNLLMRWNTLEGTAFALEETYQGKKYLWGVTASHYLFQQPSLKFSSHRAVRVPFEIQGSAGMNDISLFLIPNQFKEEIHPLQLADTPVQLGEDVFSIGYWNGKIHVDKHRTIQQIAPSRIITSLELDPNVAREGTCGSPVLNQAGKVIGIHAGNHPHRQTGVVIPLEHIRQALAAYHHGQYSQDLLFQGVRLGSLYINEYISRIELFQNDTFLASFNLYKRMQQVDYAHLEKLSNVEGTNRIVLWIERNPLSSRARDQHYYERAITYDLKTGTLEYTPLQEIQFP